MIRASFKLAGITSMLQQDFNCSVRGLLRDGRLPTQIIDSDSDIDCNFIEDDDDECETDIDDSQSESSTSMNDQDTTLDHSKPKNSKSNLIFSNCF